MGNQREYLPSGGFSQYLYAPHKDFSPITINGIRGVVVHYLPDKSTDHTGLPTYANTSDVYFRVGIKGNVIQAKVYKDRKHVLDIDWGHTHRNTNGNGKVFQKGVAHVQINIIDRAGHAYRDSDNARLMTDEEIEKYGPLIHAFAPNVIFRP